MNLEELLKQMASNAIGKSVVEYMEKEGSISYRSIMLETSHRCLIEIYQTLLQKESSDKILNQIKEIFQRYQLPVQ